MRRLLIGLATVVGVVGLTAPPAAALDAGVVSATSTFSGNDSCLEPPGTFAVDLELTGTITAAGQTYVGSAAAHAEGTYVLGPCGVHDVFGLLQAFLDGGSIAGQGPAGSVAGTCRGGSMTMAPAVGLLAIPEPHLRAFLSLACDVAVNGGAAEALLIEGQLVGPRNAGSASHLGVYTIEPL